MNKQAIYLAMLLANGGVLAGPLTVQHDVYACSSRDYFERTVKFAVANDVNAFTTA
jgi:hypothetical protein